MKTLVHTLIISSAGHLAILGFTGASFINPVRALPGTISFWGTLPFAVSTPPKTEGRMIVPGAQVPAERMCVAAAGSLKPALPARVVFPLKQHRPAEYRFGPAAQEDAAVFLHPPLPYEIQMYFKDRRQVHIQLLFKIVEGKGRSSIIVSRKVSSGNLDVDLLCERHIWHYLQMQKSRFETNKWQTVKIDLSAGPDREEDSR